ncbi:MAG: acetyl-CoA C-acyltransferase [Crocinitomicaceae bacterium]|nr:acetyl-CoA C-acyltransferase [Crocinitomicaceae bacterium]
MSHKAYIVAGFRSAVGKAGKGEFRFYRPDDLAASVIKHLVASIPQLDKDRIDDVIVGNATPEAEQGLNMGRLISLMGLGTDKVPGMTVNRYCSSGIETIALAQAKIEAGMADCIIAGGAESMYAFALNSHVKAIDAIKNGRFKEDIVPIEVEHIFLDENEKRQVKNFIVDTDEGPRASTIEALGGLKPVFANGGSVTAGNSSQTSDGAAFVMVMSEKMIKELNLEPIARLISYAVVGIEPRIMGVGPIDAIPKALKQAGLTQNDINLFELNEAFASQSLAVIRETGINPEIVNVNGGAIALGHPLGCTGAKLSVQILNELRRGNQKYGVVTMCVGTGQGAAGVWELLK